MGHSYGKKTRAWTPLACALALVLGCSSSGQSGDSAAAGEAKLTVSSTASAVRAGAGPVVIVARLENASGRVAWALEGPGGLSASDGLRTSYVPPQAVGAAAVVTVTATAGALRAQCAIELAPVDGAGIEISGRVLDDDGNPVTTEAVLVPGHPATATDSGGRFTIPGVVVPYDLVVVKGNRKIAYIYKGLKRSDPTIFLWRQADDQTRVPDRAAKLTGMVEGGDGAGSPALVNFASRELDQWYDPDSNVASSIAAPGPYSLQLEWSGPITTTGTLLALQYRQDPLSKAPTQYWYAYQSGVTLLSGQPMALVGPSLFLMPAATDTVQGIVTFPPKYTLVEKFVGLDFPGAIRFGVFRDTFSIAQPNFLYEVPDIAGAHAQVCACAKDGLPPFAGARSIGCIADIPAPNPDPRLLALREAPEPYLPVNGGDGITYASVFSWTRFDGGIHVVQFIPVVPRPEADPCTAPAGCGDDVDIDAAKFVVVTADTATTIPDLRSIGLGLDPAKQYQWRVRGMGPYESVDAFARYPVAVPPFDLPTAPEPEAFWARSRTYDFMTCGLSDCFLILQ